MSNKKEQLGMNPSTASGRLVKDILFKFISIHHPNCFHCGRPLTRESFSIEHKVAWLHSPNPKELFFDLDNIDFSHHMCNVGAARKIPKKYKTPLDQRIAHASRQKELWSRLTKEQQQARRRDKYLRFKK